MTSKLATLDDQIASRVEERGEVRDGSTLSHYASITPQVGGLQFPCGYLSPFFITDAEHMEVVFEDAYILICDTRLSFKSDLIPLIEQITKSGKPLLIVAEDIEDEVLASLVVNKLRGLLQVAAVKAPGSGDQRRRMLRDMALLTGCKAITEDLGFQLGSVQISHLGRAQRVTIDKNSTVIEGSTRATALPLQQLPKMHDSGGDPGAPAN